jgi:hypothetical protein
VTLEIVIGILIILVVLVWVVQPLRRAQLNRVQLATAPETQRLENLLFEREVALLAIRDLQLDHEMGKMSDSDFAELDIRYRAHAIEILKEWMHWEWLQRRANRLRMLRWMRGLSGQWRKRDRANAVWGQKGRRKHNRACWG